MGDAVSGLVSAAAPIAGAYFGGPAGYAAGSMLGGALSGNAQQAQSGVGAYGGYLNSQASQQGNQNAAEASQFRPVGITNTFGTSNFAFDPNTGQMTSAGYNLSPTLQGAQNTLMGGLQGNLQDTANIQAMGRQYMASSPQEQAQQYMANQQALLQPSRDMAQSQLNNNLFNQGAGGLSVAQGGNLGMANPQQQALANAQAQQNLQLAANATQAGQQQYQFGQGLLSSAYQPYNAALATSGATEALGQQPLTLSSQLGANSATAGARAAPYIQGASVNPTGQLLGGAGMSNLLGQGIAGLGSTVSGLWDSWNNPLTVDTSGAGLGSWGNVDTGQYGGASGVSIR